MGINQAVNAVRKKSLFVLCGQNVEFLGVKPVGTKSNYWAVSYNFPLNSRLFLEKVLF